MKNFLSKCYSRTQMALVFRSITKTVQSSNVQNEGEIQTRTVLCEATGKVYPGEMLAVMGPSGSGKSTLLQILGGRNLQDTKGRVYYSGKLYVKPMRKNIAFILQEDVFMPSERLTVKDHLIFAACMKLGDSTIIDTRVNEVINEVGLQHCAQTPLMLVSGGEKKRTSIGMEIMGFPRCLLVDEGTSGLDSAAAYTLITTISRLARDQKIPVCVAIHQPSERIFMSFDQILLLSGGMTVYYGPPDHIMQYFASIGFTLSSPMEDKWCKNPADVALHLLSTPHNREKMEEQWKNNTTIRTSLLKETDELLLSSLQEEEKVEMDERDIELALSGKYPSSWWIQFCSILLRSFQQNKSNRFDLLKIGEFLVISLLVGACWWQMPAAENHVVDLTGYFFFSTAFIFFFSMFQAFTEFLPERKALQKEREAGLYHLSAYFLGKTVSSATVRIALPTLYVLISYSMTIQIVTPEALLSFVCIIILASLAGESVGFLVSTLAFDYEFSLSIGTLVALGMMLLGGFYVHNIPFWLQWLKYTSAMRYSYHASLQIQVLLGAPFECVNGNVIEACRDVPVGATIPPSEVLAWMGVNDEGYDNSLSVFFNVGCLVLIFVVVRFSSYLALRFVRHNPGRR